MRTTEEWWLLIGRNGGFAYLESMIAEATADLRKELGRLRAIVDGPRTVVVQPQRMDLGRQVVAADMGGNYVSLVTRMRLVYCSVPSALLEQVDVDTIEASVLDESYRDPDAVRRVSEERSARLLGERLFARLWPSGERPQGSTVTEGPLP